MSAGFPVFGVQHDREDVARAIGLNVENLDVSLPIQTVFHWTPFHRYATQVFDNDSKSEGRFAWSQRLFGEEWRKILLLATRETTHRDAGLHARMMFYNGEDPATGSAAGCTAAWMVALGVAEPDRRVLIEQGVEMRRPSRIFVRASRRDNRIVNVLVGGNAIEVIRGEIFL